MSLNYAVIRYKFSNIQFLAFLNSFLTRFLRVDMAIFKMLLSLFM